MFGHEDEEQHNSNSNATPVASAATAPVFADPMPQLSTPPPVNTPSIATDPVVDDLSLENGAEENKNALSPAGGYPQTPTQKIRTGGDDKDEDETEETPEIKPAEPSTTAITNDDLPSIKLQVLSELFPLIDELDQTPEERFRTLMMMIQATDNQAMIKSAYEAAHNISEPKLKAQALLDIVNEINYFTQPENKE